MECFREGRDYEKTIAGTKTSVVHPFCFRNFLDPTSSSDCFYSRQPTHFKIFICRCRCDSVLPVCHSGLHTPHSTAGIFRTSRSSRCSAASTSSSHTHTLLCVCCCCCYCRVLFLTVGGIFSAFVWWKPWQLMIGQSKNASLFPAAAAAVRRQTVLIVCLSFAPYLLPDG